MFLLLAVTNKQNVGGGERVILITSSPSHKGGGDDACPMIQPLIFYNIIATHPLNLKSSTDINNDSMSILTNKIDVAQKFGVGGRAEV